jgi:hypothetical protein
MNHRFIFVIGGQVQASDGFYIERRADCKLLALCREGRFAYILSPRQIGKSSLMIHTAERLHEEGILTVILDLTELGVQVSPEQWYLGVLLNIADQLNIETDPLSWWKAHKDLPGAQLLLRFFEQVLTEEVEQRLVVFIDEVDTTLNLPFADNFFSAIRYLYDARASNPALERFSFVFIGVANPAELVHDQTLTPFSIGERIQLDDFTLEECAPLTRGFNLPAPSAQQVLKAVYRWTHGHPYLTQRACRAVYDEVRPEQSNRESDRAVKGIVERPDAEVDRIVRETFLLDGNHRTDSNLLFGEDMLTKRHSFSSELLETYRQVLRGRRPVSDEESSPIKSHLKLSGVVRGEDEILVIRNLIYRTVFNEDWVRRHMPVNRQRHGLWLALYGVLPLAVILYYLLTRLVR